MVKFDIDALVKELTTERERQLMFIESTKKNLAYADERPTSVVAKHRSHYEQRLINKLEMVQKLTKAIQLIETL